MRVITIISTLTLLGGKTQIKLLEIQSQDSVRSNVKIFKKSESYKFLFFLVFTLHRKDLRSHQLQIILLQIHLCDIIKVVGSQTSEDYQQFKNGPEMTEVMQNLNQRLGLPLGFLTHSQ